MNENKIGIGIITHNRPHYLQSLLESLKFCKGKGYKIVVVNDGDELDSQTFNETWYTVVKNRINIGVAMSKNKALRWIGNQGCKFFFLIEDDMIIKDPTVFEQYINAHIVSGIHHFSYGPGSPFNREQKIQHFDLHNRDLLETDTPPKPRLIVQYPKDINIAFYEHTVAMFAFFTKEVLEKVGGMPEDYDRCWEHVDHTYQIIKAGYHPPFWWFADLANSHELMTEAPGAINNSVIAQDREAWMNRVMAGREIYKRRHGHYPNLPPQKSQKDVLEILKQLAKR